MRQLFPEPVDVDSIEAYGRLSPTKGRPSVRLNMIATLDGAASITGRSGGLGGPADKAILGALRCLGDVILIGAATLRTESYGPARLDSTARERRRQWGLAPDPPIAVLTRACRLDWNSPLFTDATQRPIVITTTSADPADRACAARVAEVIVAGEDGVDLARAMSALGELGHDNVLAEGGPGVAAQLAGLDLLDELCLSVAPLLVGGDASRILNGEALAVPRRLELRHVLTDDGYLFLRYGRR